MFMASEAPVIPGVGPSPVAQNWKWGINLDYFLTIEWKIALEKKQAFPFYVCFSILGAHVIGSMKDNEE